MPIPFEDSRRLTGANLFFSEPGAVLETAPGVVTDDVVAAWRARIEFARGALSWPTAPIVARIRTGGAALAFAAPADQLFTATEVNEWAFLLAMRGCAGWTDDEMFLAPAFPTLHNDDLALRTLRLASAAERRPDLTSLLDVAQQRDLPVLLDDAQLTLGEGTGARSWSLDALPPVEIVDWSTLHAIPVALVTGSNGKTTTTRLVAAMSELHGRRTAYSCTDGVFVGAEPVASGDYSGPAGARTALRHADAEAAILETARGGILRRGLAVDRVQAAIVTNVSADHFGEYGIDDLAGLADTKLVVARALAADGILVLNADDAMLVQRAATLSCRIAWFALDADQPLLRGHRDRDGATCGVRDGELILHCDGRQHTLGRISDMPLTMRGAATYNIANIAGSALLASALGIPTATIASVLARFGRDNADNPGRLMRWSFGTSTVLVDYAHNPEGLHGLLDVANGLRGLPPSGPSDHPRSGRGQALPPQAGEGNLVRLAAASCHGRLALVLGQAGNREDADIRKLAATAASFRPELIVLKDIESHLRGRAPGETATILKDELLRNGIAQASITTCLDEVEAARTTLCWARAGDVLVLPIHDRRARDELVRMIDRLATTSWSPGAPLPPT
jgi:UDP-N-acetylmuramyl tripeptide synthase